MSVEFINDVTEIMVMAFYFMSLAAGFRLLLCSRSWTHRTMAWTTITISAFWIVAYIYLLIYDLGSPSTIGGLFFRFGHYMTASGLYLGAALAYRIGQVQVVAANHE